MVSSDERTGSIYVNRFPYLLINFQYSTESNLRPNDCAGRVGRLEKPPKRQFLEFATSDGIHLVVQLTTVPTTQLPSLQRLPVARYGASTVRQFTNPFSVAISKRDEPEIRDVVQKIVQGIPLLSTSTSTTEIRHDASQSSTSDFNESGAIRFGTSAARGSLGRLQDRRHTVQLQLAHSRLRIKQRVQLSSTSVHSSR